MWLVDASFISRALAARFGMVARPQLGDDPAATASLDLQFFLSRSCRQQGNPHDMEPIRFPGPGRGFDHLCDVCKITFQRDFFKDAKSPKLHRNIYTLSTSTDEGCHICSLIMASIPPEVVNHLKLDLDNSPVEHCEQIAIVFEGFQRYNNLAVRAQSPSALPCARYITSSNGCYKVAELMILPASDDYTRSDRILGSSNYSELTIMQITQWLGQYIREHTDCSAMQVIVATRDILPTRLLDLTQVKFDGQVRLVSTESLLCNTIYATLSYCWGGRCGLTLTMNDLA
jgi:hypothetical protein